MCKSICLRTRRADLLALKAEMTRAKEDAEAMAKQVCPFLKAVYL
jgi:hypothetical protein